MKGLVFFLGIAIFVVSMFLAFFLRCNHFYEFTLIGLFLLLLALVPKGMMDKKQYFYLYILFIGGGLIADLLLGLAITKLWHYNYTSYLEYIPLYLLIYPLGGIVLVQTFLVFKHRFMKNLRLSRKKYAGIFMIFGLVFLVASLLIIFLSFRLPYFGVFLFFSLTVLAFFIFNFLAEHFGTSYLKILIEKPFSCMFITLLTAYIHCLIHEVPNIFARQWVYQNFPFQNITVFNIPVFVFFVGWAFLAAVPVSTYFYIRSYLYKQ